MLCCFQLFRHFVDHVQVNMVRDKLKNSFFFYKFKLGYRAANVARRIYNVCRQGAVASQHLFREFERIYSFNFSFSMTNGLCELGSSSNDTFPSLNRLNHFCAVFSLTTPTLRILQMHLATFAVVYSNLNT